MATYSVSAVVKNRLDYPGGREKVDRTINTRFAGCTDEADAKQKARQIYDVIVFKKVELVIE